MRTAAAVTSLVTDFVDNPDAVLYADPAQQDRWGRGVLRDLLLYSHPARWSQLDLSPALHRRLCRSLVNTMLRVPDRRQKRFRAIMKSIPLTTVAAADPFIVRRVVNSWLFSVGNVFALVKSGNATSKEIYTLLSTPRRAHIDRLLARLPTKKHTVWHGRPNTAADCAHMMATIYQYVVPTQTHVLPIEGVVRNRRINVVEGPRTHPALIVNVKKGNVPASVTNRMLTDSIGDCLFMPWINPGMRNTASRTNKVVVRDKTDEVVAAASFTVERQDSQLIVDHVCSGRSCRGGGSAALRALDMYAGLRGLRTIALESVANAIPFYYKLGFTQDNTKENTVNTLRVNGGRIVYPRRQEVWMVKTVGRRS